MLATREAVTEASASANASCLAACEWAAGPEQAHQYYRARYYDPKVGRFISEDPIAFEHSEFNLYAYVRNKPVVRTDPFGLMSWPEAQAKGMSWNEWWQDPATTMQDKENGEVIEPNPAVDPVDMVAGAITLTGPVTKTVTGKPLRAFCRLDPPHHGRGPHIHIGPFEFGPTIPKHITWPGWWEWVKGFF